MPRSITQKLTTPTTYSILLTRVKQTLIEGQQRIEAERVRTYWETGRLIRDYILKHADRAEYGAHVIERLAKDIGIHKKLLERCIKFVKAYPHLPIATARSQFSWTHYRELASIEDDTKRLQLEKAAIRHGWSTDELIARIKADRPEDSDLEEKRPVSQKLLTPLRGQLYTYRLVERPNLGSEDPGLLLDLGFGVFRNVDPRQLSQFSKDDIVESRAVSEANAPKPRSGVGLPRYRVSKTDRTQKDLFTYKAYIEKVIDGDTLKVCVDLGFDTWHRETLRLRDIDCPEMDTKAGQEAKAFVQSLLKEASWIVVRSSRSDKYDRYLADVFIPPLDDLGLDKNAPRADRRVGVSTSEEDIYLNNLLLEKGYAKRAE